MSKSISISYGALADINNSTTPEQSTLVKSAKAYHIVTRYLIWEGDAELLNDQELYTSFMKLPVEPSGPWVKGHMVKTYSYAWWNTTFDILPYGDLITNFPSTNQLTQMIGNHFTQLLEGYMLVTPATLVLPRSILVAQQLAAIQAEIDHEENAIIKMMENKVVEAKLLAVSMLKMKATLSNNILQAVRVMEHLVKYGKKKSLD
ncbi:hypothetical protein C8R48DRAFT_672807 [Suillus tomentosus]|nr:hypothetical protein C8R48DRAFT_672807 [Suillus tomentosus]